ncbi:MAG: hypothetical protein JWR08_617, partial [Enterovirga sp.]|nr:hypothetical protein [Enterovirga sp.]
RSEVTAVAAALPAPSAGAGPVSPAGVPSSMPVAAAETTVAAAAPVAEARQAASSPVSPASAGEFTRPSEAARVAAVTGPTGPAMPPTAALPPAAPPSAATPADPVRGNRPEAVLAAALPLSDLRPRDPRDEIEATLKSFECARVSAAFDPGSGSVVLKGHLRSASDRGRMADRIASLAGVDKVDGSGLSVVGEPYCRVLAFLDRPAFQRSTEQKHDLAVVGTTNQPGLKRLAGGEALSLGLGAPEFDSYLYVDHFSVDGRVTHLLPTDRPDNFFKADTGFRLGPGGYGRRAIASPPYGLDLVVVVAASEPLLVRPRPIQEDAAPYLALLNERVRALEASSLKLRVEYAYYLVATEPPRASQ